MKKGREKTRNRFGCGDRYQPLQPRKFLFFEAFRTLPEAFTGPYIHLRGDSRLVIEGCREILSCGENHIRASVRGFVLDIFGLELSVEGYTEDSVTVFGRIRSLSLEPVGNPAGKGTGKGGQNG